MERKRRKTTISVVLSPHLVDKIDKAVQEEKYAGQSDLVSIALTEHFFKEEQKLKEDDLIFLLEIALDDEDFRNKLQTLSKDPKTRVEALKQKALACAKLGEFDEAAENLAKAKELESKPETNIPERIVYDHQKEKEECLKAICPEPRELTPEEARKAAEAKEYYKNLLGEDSAEKEETVAEQLKKDKVPDIINRRVTFE